MRTLDYYPTEVELVRLLRSYTPQTVLVSVEAISEAVAAAKVVEAQVPGVQVLALGQNPSPDVLIEMMRAGVREILQAPFDDRTVLEVMGRVMEVAERAPRVTEMTDLVFSFLPSRAGVGTTTVAVNLSAALAELPNHRVLLADFDLNSGLVAFMLKLSNPYSVTSAAENSFHLDENLWTQLVSSCGGLDVLAAGKIEPGFRIDTPQIRSLLDYARRHYKAVCIDHSGNLEKYSVELMQASKRIFLVCTAELPSLHLAREKLGFLRSAELGNRVSIVLNRASKHDLVNAQEVETLLGQPVHFTFPNDYKGIHKAVAAGSPIDPGSELAKRFRHAAKVLLANGDADEQGKRKFVEYFALSPARYTLFGGQKKQPT